MLALCYNTGMKKILAILILTYGVAVAQTMEDVKRARENPLSLTCKQMQQKNQKDVQFRTDYGSSIICTTRKTLYTAQLRWMGKKPQKVTIEHGTIMSVDKGAPIITRSGSKELELEPQKSTAIDLETDTTEQTRTDLVAIEHRSVEGEKVKGLVVRVLIDGQIISAWTSDGSWKKRAWEPNLF